jgi:hypothetical protein
MNADWAHARTKWASLDLGDNTFHVIPVADLKDHEDSAHCWCKPQVEKSAKGRVVVSHNSLDGREFLQDVPKGH